MICSQITEESSVSQFPFSSFNFKSLSVFGFIFSFMVPVKVNAKEKFRESVSRVVNQTHQTQVIDPSKFRKLYTVTDFRRNKITKKLLKKVIQKAPPHLKDCSFFFQDFLLNHIFIFENQSKPIIKNSGFEKSGMKYARTALVNLDPNMSGFIQKYDPNLDFQVGFVKKLLIRAGKFVQKTINPVMKQKEKTTFQLFKEKVENYLPKRDESFSRYLANKLNQGLTFLVKHPEYLSFLLVLFVFSHLIPVFSNLKPQQAFWDIVSTFKKGQEKEILSPQRIHIQEKPSSTFKKNVEKPIQKEVEKPSTPNCVCSNEGVEKLAQKLRLHPESVFKEITKQNMDQFYDQVNGLVDRINSDNGCEICPLDYGSLHYGSPEYRAIEEANAPELILPDVTVPKVVADVLPELPLDPTVVFGPENNPEPTIIFGPENNPEPSVFFGPKNKERLIDGCISTEEEFSQIEFANLNRPNSRFNPVTPENVKEFMLDTLLYIQDLNNQKGCPHPEKWTALQWKILRLIHLDKLLEEEDAIWADGGK